MKILATVSKGQRIKQLEKWVMEAKTVYYNTGKFAVIEGKKVTDALFDAWEDELRDLSPTSEALKTVGAKVVKGKVPLPYKLYSLDKIKPQTGAVGTWASKKKGPYVVSDKLDGVSIEVIYNQGKPTKAYTRGNGIEGQDISHLIDDMNVPKKAGNEKVRGEIIMSKSKFMAWESQYENARNMIAGLANRKDIHKAIKDVDVIAYERLDNRTTLSKDLAKLKTLGFKVVAHKVYDTISDSMLSDLLIKRKSTSKYEIDGLVVYQDKKTTLAETGNPDYAVAFKMTTEDDKAEVTVESVEWEVSKHGYLKPVVIVNPVRLSGVTITRVTGHNGANIYNNKIGPGTKLLITRSGDVIPYILKVIKGTKASLPSVKQFGEWDWNDTDVDIVLLNPDANNTVAIKRINNFFRTIGLEDVSIGLVDRLYSSGFDTIKKICEIKVSQILKVPGFQQKSAQKVRDSLDKALTDAYLPSVLDGSGFFGRGLGTRRVEMIQEAYPDVIGLAKLNPDLLLKRILNIPGFNNVMAQQFVAGIQPFAKWIQTIPISIAKPVKVTIKSGKLNGHLVAFTGFRNKALEDTIIQNGGKIASGVSSTTTDLLAKDPTSGSSKVKAAQSLGVKVWSESQFVKKFGI